MDKESKNFKPSDDVQPGGFALSESEKSVVSEDNGTQSGQNLSSPNSKTENLNQQISEKQIKRKAFIKKAAQKTKSVLKYIFIDGMSGMTLGLFATLIIGTIITQIGNFIPGKIGTVIVYAGNFAKTLMGAGIAIGMGLKLKKPPLVTLSAAVAGMIGAFATEILKGTAVSIGKPGDPLSSFITAFIALEVCSLVSGKTKVDIVVTPLVSFCAATLAAVIVGPPVSAFMQFLGSVINAAAESQSVIMGIPIAAIMGIILTLPISSAAIGLMLGLSGVAAGAAVAGCCAHMVGFAVASFRENKWGGLIAQGIGTSMLQMPNLVKKPVLWIPAVVASIFSGMTASLLGMTCSPVGAGMGTAGLVGNIETFFSMTANGIPAYITLIEIVCVQFLLPAIVALIVSEILRKYRIIKYGDLKLDI